MIIIVNRETGEEKILQPDSNGKYPNIKLPWIPQGSTIRTNTRLHQIIEEGRALRDLITLSVTSKIFSNGADLIESLAKLFQIEPCSKCNMRSKVAKHVYEIGATKAIKFLYRSVYLKEDSIAYKQLQAEIQESLDAGHDH